ncbi:MULTISPECIES: hypothetical protein [Rhizobium]|jgi:hypothetical protein|uniref:Uncharacterized protein n=1 Tax=Rhizobium leguminosarum TaxID=384 RepID=A0ABD7PQ39_RHILE|nr:MULTISPECIES: hypothetical protein [Rhizobium]NEI65914.1 hypothetical protein [Rhizobium leguminosarum]TAW21239.1 hypothetical protein ELI20_08440 [Rhizobium ruizarguesonis]TAW29404.1 hypothetical protein ELI19_07800 [Rhizobium leguminosarum]TAW43132.1 hypothetical protein ELI18_07740 [Rhizobium leguminosarum]
MNYLPTTTISVSANLVDLCGGYKAFLEEIDAANALRLYQGESLIPYPTFEEFVADCTAAASIPNHKFSARLDELVAITLVFDEGDPDDGLYLDKLLPLPAFGFMSEAEEASVADNIMPPWETEFGSFVFGNSTKH